MEITSNNHIEDDNFASGELECGHFEMKKETVSFSQRFSMISLGLNIRCQKLCSKVIEYRNQYLTEKLIGIVSLIVLLFICFCILSQIITHNASQIRGRFIINSIYPYFVLIYLNMNIMNFSFCEILPCHRLHFQITHQISQKVAPLVCLSGFI